MGTAAFSTRHIGPSEKELKAMLKRIGVADLDALIDRTVPKGIRNNKALDLPTGRSEQDHLAHMHALAQKNGSHRSFIGLGYYGTVVPPVIQRNVLENPGWYTAYTPYQAEISQGRLEALLNFQTMVSSLTGLPIANASLLDEGTAAAEAMLMFFHTRSREQLKSNAKRFFVSRDLFPQTIDVLRSRAIPAGIELEIGDHEQLDPTADHFGAMFQYPALDGSIRDLRTKVAALKALGIRVAVATDLLALTLLTPPGEWGADVAVGNSQRFGVPMGYGGPHAAFFATTDDLKRVIPGRIIGVSQDRHGHPGYRMALQTREQHIRRDKATSNICTAQALLAVMAGMYAVYHGPAGLRAIAEETNALLATFIDAAKTLGYRPLNDTWFDTVNLALPTGMKSIDVRIRMEAAGFDAWYPSETSIALSFDQTTDLDDVHAVTQVLAEALGRPAPSMATANAGVSIPEALQRRTPILDHEVFNTYHTETKLMRYLKRLENKDLSLTHGMIPLGSCTMKLNAASTLMPITIPGFANVHPFAPKDRVAGYQEIFKELSLALGTITGLPGVSLQPNSGAQGEFAGLMVMRAKHEADGQAQRDVVLIPSSAHGTNPASAVMAGMKVVVVKCDEKGNIDLPDLEAKAEQHKALLAGLMVTYPSTHGVFEEHIKQVTSCIHKHGGLVYMDGANMNAQVGLTNPGAIGADVCHLNLHKTFAIPHGGGGPGMGPICCTKELEPFLPGHPLVKVGGEQAIPALSAAPWGSALILLISYGYIQMLGAEGTTMSTKVAILNANYIKTRLQAHYPVLYTGSNDTVAHELILDCREFKKTAGVEVEDIAKRLMDYGFHAPTVSFPVAGTLMIEPTESEDQAELDRFCDAMISIRMEIEEIVEGKADREDNVLKMSPHTMQEVAGNAWAHVYTRAQAAFPANANRTSKYWPPVARVDNAYGDRNLVCTCPPMEAYEELAV